MMEKSNIFTKTVFKRINKVGNNIILEGKEEGLEIYRDNDKYVCNGEVFNIDYKTCLEVLPFSSLVRLVEGYIIYMSNIVRVKENVEFFSKYDIELIKKFAYLECNYWNDIYKNNKKKRVIYKQDFQSYCINVGDVKVNIGCNGLSTILDNKRNRLENAQYLMTSKLNTVALINRCLFNIRKEQDVKAIYDSIDPSMIDVYSEIINNAESIDNLDNFLFIPATVESINDVTHNSNIAFKKHIIDIAFDFDSKAVKLKNRGWVELR